jgi:hypothetical protein
MSRRALPLHGGFRGSNPLLLLRDLEVLELGSLLLPLPGYRLSNTKPSELRFRALLTDGTRAVRLERVAVG